MKILYKKIAPEDLEMEVVDKDENYASKNGYDEIRYFLDDSDFPHTVIVLKKITVSQEG